jgi:hypothetical protein
VILAALAFDHLMASFGMRWEQWKRGYMVVASFLIVFVFAFNVWVYFFDFAAGCRYATDNPLARYESFLGTYLDTLPRDVPVYLLSDDNYLYGPNPVVDFLSHFHAIENYPDPVDTLSLVSGDIVIATPNRIDELFSWIRAHPGGKTHVQMDCKESILLGYQEP